MGNLRFRFCVGVLHEVCNVDLDCCLEQVDLRRRGFVVDLHRLCRVREASLSFRPVAAIGFDAILPGKYVPLCPVW